MIGVGTFETTDRMRELVAEVLDSNRLSYGDKSKEFEKTFAGLHDCRHAVLSNSGTSSLQVALQALKEIIRLRPYSRPRWRNQPGAGLW